MEGLTKQHEYSSADEEMNRDQKQVENNVTPWNINETQEIE